MTSAMDNGSPSVAPKTKRRIGILLFDGVKTLDFVGPAEVFVEANQSVDDYEIVLMSPDGADIQTSIGARVAVQSSAADAGRFDTVMVPGSQLPASEFATPQVIDAARLLSGRTRRLSSICSGAYILARIGALDGRRATTHWKFAHQMTREFPAIHIEPDAIFVRDGDVYSSAGVAAGIDLALSLVEEDHGPDTARAVAKLLVVYMKRSGGQSQFSVALQSQAPQTDVVREVVEFIEADPARPITTLDMARHVNLSVRHLTRLFQSDFGSTPLEYLTALRFDLARVALEAGLSVGEAAMRSGYTSAENLRRVFIARLGISPRQYQKQFYSTTDDVPLQAAMGLVAAIA